MMVTKKEKKTLEGLSFKNKWGSIRKEKNSDFF